jgi:ketosteroid isomerase-like protein
VALQDDEAGSDQARIRQTYAAFNTRDIEGALALMHEDVAWPNGMEGGYVHGHAEVRDYWTRQWQTIDPTVDPLELRDEPDGRVAVSVHQVVRDRSGALLADRMVTHVYRLEAGLITHMDIRAN